MIAGTFRHVVWPLVEPALDMGWIPICDDNPYSWLMRACDCNPEGRLPFETRSTHRDPQTN